MTEELAELDWSDVSKLQTRCGYSVLGVFDTSCRYKGPKKLVVYKDNQGNACTVSVHHNGLMVDGLGEGAGDIIPRPRKTVTKKGWVNIYKDTTALGEAGRVFPTKEECDEYPLNRLACVPVEWEEPTAEEEKPKTKTVTLWRPTYSMSRDHTWASTDCFWMSKDYYDKDYYENVYMGIQGPLESREFEVKEG